MRRPTRRQGCSPCAGCRTRCSTGPERTTLALLRQMIDCGANVAKVGHMNLRIRNPLARELARQLAAKRKVSMTRAVIEALESELKNARMPLAERLAAIAGDLRSKAGKAGRVVSKNEIDAMWGGG
ncbi:type II toxin-antitoxin system VapB family antitoxin, partial [Mesorhizobium sp. M7A.F.Ca.CA.004.09.1.2]